MDYLKGKVALVIGGGGDMHRGVAVALAQAGADVAISGVAPDLVAEATLHSISNEIWALGRRSTVVTLVSDDAPGFADVVERAKGELGRTDVVVRADAVLGG